MFCKKNWEEIIFLKINAWEKTIETFIGASDFCLTSIVGLLLFCWIKNEPNLVRISYKIYFRPVYIFPSVFMQNKTYVYFHWNMILIEKFQNVFKVLYFWISNFFHLKCDHKFLYTENQWIMTRASLHHSPSKIVRFLEHKKSL